MFIWVKVIETSTPTRDHLIKTNPPVINNYKSMVVNTNHIVKIENCVNKVEYDGKIFSKSKMKLSDGSSFEVMGEVVSIENGEIDIT